jgi:hypothetical protein
MRKPFIFGTFSLFLVMLFCGAAMAADGPVTGPTKLTNQLLTGKEELPLSADYSSHMSTSRQVSPGIKIGATRYDYQHNGSMGRQVVYTFEGTQNMYNGVHFDWMCLPCPGVTPTFRHIRYNSQDIAGNWTGGTGGDDSGTDIPQENGGYCSIDATQQGQMIPCFHHGPDPDQYHSYVYVDVSVGGLGFWVDNANPGPMESVPPPNCQGIITGNYEMGSPPETPSSQYIWPKVEFDVCGTGPNDSIFHKVATESPPTGAPAGEIQTMVYYRDVWDNATQSIIVPPCGTFIDSVYNITGIVRQDPTSQEVAIVWGHPIFYDGDANDPCGFTQWQNDVWVWKSSDCGVTWNPLDTHNITNYTDNGAYSIDNSDDVPYLFYTDLSAIYDHEGILHVVWSTPIRDGCNPQYASRMWHWDDFNNCISLCYDASTPRFFFDPGAWNNSTCKMNISECHVDGTTRFYVQFTRFGFHTSADGDTSQDASAAGYENGDIGIVGSSDGGQTWSAAVNITNTQTDGCGPGDCHSEHWSSMAKYSYDSVMIEYIEDKDAGGYPQTEGELTCNPVRYVTHPCFPIDPFCDFAYSPIEVGYPTHIAPDDGSTDCTSPTTTTFSVTVTNTGNQSTAYNITDDAGWLNATGGDPTSGTLGVGCNATIQITYTIGPIATEGIYDATITINACGRDETIPVRVYVYCYFYEPEYDILSTACWSIGVWNNARAGTAQWDDPEGNMYWFLPIELPFMYDESVIITYADDTTISWFSMFDGSDDEVSLVAQSYLDTATIDGYQYGHGLWSTGDTAIMGEIEYFLPIHPDTCVLIERIKICNNRETTMTIHIGEGIDWDIPDSEDANNDTAYADAGRQEVYVCGSPVGSPNEDYCGGAGWCHEIPGAIVLDNATWIYPNSGFEPDEVGGLLNSLVGFDATTYVDSLQDLCAVYVVDRNVVLEPDSCVVYCKVKTSSLTGVADVQALIDKGKQWIIDHEIDCPGCEPGECDAFPGDANASGGVDIDDVVYLIAYIFSGGPAPVPYAIASGDPNCSCSVDIDDVVYLIAYIFSGGPEPCLCDAWVASCGPLP